MPEIAGLSNLRILPAHIALSVMESGDDINELSFRSPVLFSAGPASPRRVFFDSTHQAIFLRIIDLSERLEEIDRRRRLLEELPPPRERGRTWSTSFPLRAAFPYFFSISRRALFLAERRAISSGFPWKRAYSRL